MKKKEGERIRGKYQGEEKQRRVWTDGRTGIEGSIRGPPKSWGLTCRQVVQRVRIDDKGNMIRIS